MTFKRYEPLHFKRVKQPGAKNISNELYHWSLFAAAGYAGEPVEFARRVSRRLVVSPVTEEEQHSIDAGEDTTDRCCGVQLSVYAL